LSAAHLYSLGPDDAAAHLQAIRGIGPFYAALIVIRAVGFADIAPTHEPRAQRLLGELYGLGAAATPDQFEQIAEAWRPWRAWASVYVRAVGPRVLAAVPARSA
jgi:DNA-3-methyladenine glycosylase II